MTDDWPQLNYSDWSATCDTLHAHTQVLGKLSVALAPPEPQLQHAALRLTARGWETLPLSAPDRSGALLAGLDLHAHEAFVEHSDGRGGRVALTPNRAVGEVTRELLDVARSLAGPVEIDATPQEVWWSSPLDQDDEHVTYDAAAVTSYFAGATRAALVLAAFRAPYRGRSTPVNAWWGSFDLAVNLFSGSAAEPPSPDFILRDAMDAQEVAVGWWPGGRVGKALHEVAVVALGDRDRAVAELALDVDQRLAGQQPGGGGRVPERVQRHVAQARVLERLLVPVAGDEHGVVGQVAGVQLGLAGIVIAQDPQQPGADGHRPEAAALGVVEAAANALAEDADHPPVEVDVVPAQRERLADPHARGDQQLGDGAVELRARRQVQRDLAPAQPVAFDVAPGRCAMCWHGLEGILCSAMASFGHVLRQLRVLLTVLGASPPASTSSTISAAKLRTTWTSIAERRIGPKYGFSRRSPAAR